MEVKKFAYFSKDDGHDMRFKHELCWSRVYEYPFVLAEIYENKDKGIRIHNCSWGFRDIHAVFKTWLDVFYDNVVHSDVIPSTLYGTDIWDIRTKSRYVGEFDFCLNVSTVEEVPGDHVEVIKNHLDQLKDGGKLVMTFDVPGIQLERVEAFLGRKIDDVKERLNPHNSVLPDRVLRLPPSFNVGYLVIQK